MDEACLQKLCGKLLRNTYMGETEPGMARRMDDEHVASPLVSLSRAQGLPEVREAFFSARDGARLRFAAWATPAARRGTVVFLQGRTEFIEKNLETLGILLRHGFDVWTLDWRGQGLSGREADHRHKGHFRDYRLYLDDLHRFVGEVVRLPEADGQRVMLGHSMGAHIGLRYLHDHPDAFDRAAFSSAMVDLRLPARPAIEWLTRLRCQLGRETSWVLLRGDYSPICPDPASATVEDYKARFYRFRALTSDAGRARQMDMLRHQTPELALGRPTIGWLQATFTSIAILNAPGFPEAITTPALLVGAGSDIVVSTPAQRQLAARMPSARFEEIPGAAHELLMECDDLRHRFFDHVGAFLGMRFDLPLPQTTNCVR
jgi:lysophospholipase